MATKDKSTGRPEAKPTMNPLIRTRFYAHPRAFEDKPLLEIELPAIPEPGEMWIMPDSTRHQVWNRVWGVLDGTLVCAISLQPKPQSKPFVPPKDVDDNGD